VIILYIFIKIYNKKHKKNHCIIDKHHIGCTKCDEVYKVMSELIQFRGGIIINSENKGKSSYAVIECSCTNQFKLTWESLRTGS